MRPIDADALINSGFPIVYHTEYGDAVISIEDIKNAPTVEPEVKDDIIRCQNCKCRVKEWREDKRMKEKGYWQYGCSHFGDMAGYWCFGGSDNEFCSDAERIDMKGGAE